MKTVRQILNQKNKQKISMLTAYDYLTAKILEETGIDMILIGDSLGSVVMGYSATVEVTVEEIIHHARAVRKGAPDTFIVADMPFLSYGISLEYDLLQAGRIMKKTGANAVKLEGGAEKAELIQRLTQIGIPVMGHIGLKPQSVHLKGLRIAGRTEKEKEELISDALALEKAGVFSIVLEGVTAEAAEAVTEAVKIVTIGIGAGPETDGQVLVITDMLGMDSSSQFRHNKKYADLHQIITNAVTGYIEEVKTETFPDNSHYINMNQK